MNISSKLWTVRADNCFGAHVIQRATGASRSVAIAALPSLNQLALMHESAFNALMRRVFKGSR